MGGEFDGADLLLLTTTGAKTGRNRLAVLADVSVEGRMIIVGSLGGAPNHPDWVHNLRANPRPFVEVGESGHDVVARELPPAERNETFPKSCCTANTFRRIPEQGSAGHPAVRIAACLTRYRRSPHLRVPTRTKSGRAIKNACLATATGAALQA